MRRTGSARRVGAERRARQARAGTARRSNAARTPSPHARSSPAWWISSKITNAPRGDRGAARRRCDGDLLVGGDHAVHVGRQRAVARRPLRARGAGRSGAAASAHCSLRCCGRRHHHDPPARAVGQALPRGGEGEGRLAGAGRGHGQEVGVADGPRGCRQGAASARPELDGAGHDGGGEVVHQRPDERSWSAVPHSSRTECIASWATPTSTTGTPRLAAVMGPTVEPQGIVVWDTNRWTGTPAASHASEERADADARRWRSAAGR